MLKDPYLYDDSETLINLFDEHDDKILKEIEANFTTLRLRQLYERHINGNFDFAHLCRIHKYIFQDIYSWAGVPRTINIEKEEAVLGGISVEYSNYENIKKDTDNILSKLLCINWNNLSLEEKAKEFSVNISLLWKVHPFREGNTRTVITFACDFADAHNFQINRTLLEQNSIYLRASLVAATAVFKDIGDKSQIKYLYNIILDSIK